MTINNLKYMTIKKELLELMVNPLVVIPIYNHGKTLRNIAERSLATGYDVLIVDDGSTDDGVNTVRDLPVSIITHKQNKGKGQAILTAANEAKILGKTHIITIDSDGQHFPEEIPLFVTAINKSPRAIIIGCRDFNGENIPNSSKFGRNFSNFWLRVQTGIKISDVQSGFRAYPVEIFPVLKTTERRYAFEVEILVKAAWAGFTLKDQPIRVHYPHPSERISHFKALKDNIQISLLNTRLTARAFLPVPHRQYDKDENGKISPIHPLRSLKLLLSKDETPFTLSISGAIGMLLGTLPLIAMHSIVIILVCGYFRLSKITGLAVSQICIPPIIPALCIETGYYLQHKEFLTDISLQTIGYEALDRLYEWILGSLVLGPLFAITVGLAIYVMASIIKHFITIKNTKK